MRKFYLQNHKPERLDISQANSFFLSSPTGLGMNRSFGYNTDGMGFASVSEKMWDQINIVGDIIISQNCYSRYRTLADFILNANKLIFIYAPDGNREYCLDVECEYITKTEINAGTLTCPISFRALTPWYRTEPDTCRIVQTIPIKKPWKYPCTYPMRYSVIQNNSTVLRAKGHIPAALDVYVKGKLVNPVITLKRANDGKTIGRLNPQITVQKTQTLHLCTKYNGDAGVWIDRRSIVNQINLSDNVFFRLPVNENCTITLTDDEYSTASMTVYIHNYYNAV